MTCPRCKGRMYKAQDEMRLDQGEVASLTAAECLACINCGNRIYPHIAPAMPFDNSMKLPKPEYMIGAKPGRRPSHGDLMRKYFDSVHSMRVGKNPTGWDAIARLISTAEGIKLAGGTVQKYYTQLNQVKRKGGRYDLR